MEVGRLKRAIIPLPPHLFLCRAISSSLASRYNLIVASPLLAGVRASGDTNPAKELLKLMKKHGNPA
jgi:hypothetical protein